MQFQYSTKLSECQEVLHDVSPSGKERPWHVRKLENQYISAAYDEVNKKKAVRLSECADSLLFQRTERGSLKLKHANFCRVRLCPICGWRRSLKTQAHIQKILAAAEQQKLEYVLVTLTLKNCSGEKLSSTLDTLMNGYKVMMKRKRYKSAVAGWYRGVEITHKGEDDFHPHIHAIWAVKPAYFKGKDYITQAQLCSDWKDTCRLSYTPVVDIRRVKRHGSTKCVTRSDLLHAVCEVAKYTVKASDIINFDDWGLTVDTVKLLDFVLDKRRFISFGGLFKELHKQLNLDDIEQGDLVNVDGESEESGRAADELLFFWNTGYCRYVR